MRPIQVTPRGVGLFLIEAGAVRGACTFDLGQTAANNRAAGDHRGARVLFGEQDRGGDRVRVVTVHLLNVPITETEAGDHVIGERNVDRAVIRHPVVIPEEDELAEAKMAGKRDDLLADALLEAAVADQCVGIVVNDIGPEHVAEECLGERHAGCVGDPLAKRTGRHLDAAIGVVFRMALATRAELAEATDVLQRDLFVAAEMQQRIEQHRAVPVRFDKAVAVEPERVLRIELEMLGEQRRGDVGRTKRRAGMALASVLDRIHGEKADGVGHQS